MLLDGQDLIVTTTNFRSAPQLAMLMGVGLCGFVGAWFVTGGGRAGVPWRRIVARDDTGGRVTLHVRDEDGQREVLLRFGSGRSKLFTALVRELAPDARIREPGWRTST